MTYTIGDKVVDNHGHNWTIIGRTSRGQYVVEAPGGVRIATYPPAHLTLRADRD